MAENIQALLASELERVPEPRRHAMQPFLIEPYRVVLEHGYCADTVECWIVAVSPNVLLAYCEAGLSDEYRWGILAPESADLGRDDAWHVSLDDAFMNSSLCSRDLIPKGYEVP